uniref:YeeE/YedE family protein n=1 Tax=Parerythrobacter lutipelagi TaxID=1964208 RepID=UPI001F0311C2|nr:YeeE/YedE thiosulfate transporter family protein [Parerythrobacter lutipelagi]
MITQWFPDAQPLQGLIGGMLIGLAGAIMLLGVGRIAGVSGMFARATAISRSGTPWPIAALFTLGLLVGAFAHLGAIGPVEATFPPSTSLLVAGGLIVGFGTRMGSGCTSGHGVCGMSRLSPRSLVATATFMASGMVTVAIVNALGGAW